MELVFSRERKSGLLADGDEKSKLNTIVLLTNSAYQYDDSRSEIT